MSIAIVITYLRRTKVGTICSDLGGFTHSHVMLSTSLRAARPTR